VTIAQTSQLLQLVLNSAVMMLIALLWWGVVVFRLNTVSGQLQRFRQKTVDSRDRRLDGTSKGSIPSARQISERQFRRQRPYSVDRSLHRSQFRMRQQRHDLRVRYRLTRHSALIMHYVLLAQMTSLFLLSLRALVNSNMLITMALFMFVFGAAGILLSVALALLEFYQLSRLTVSEPDWQKARPSPSAMGAVAPQEHATLHPQTPSLAAITHQSESKDDQSPSARAMAI